VSEELALSAEVLHDEDPPVPPNTARWLWWAAGLTLAATLVAREAAIRSMVMTKLAASSVDDQLTDHHMRSLAVNMGIVLAMVLSLLLFSIYASLGRALEKSVFPRSVTLGGVRAGLFFVVAAAVTLVPTVGAAASGAVSWRTSPWYYVWAVLVGCGAPVLFMRHLRGARLSRVALLMAMSIAFAFLATLI